MTNSPMRLAAVAEWHESEVVFLLSTLAKIREALGVGIKPMLEELPDVAQKIVADLQAKVSELEEINHGLAEDADYASALTAENAALKLANSQRAMRYSIIVSELKKLDDIDGVINLFGVLMGQDLPDAPPDMDEMIAWLAQKMRVDS